jgi:uncharacterized protein (DUF3084 family)
MAMIDRDSARTWSRERTTQELEDLRRIISENRATIQEHGEVIRKREQEIHPGRIVERLEDQISFLENEIADAENDIEFLKSLL